MHAVFDGEAAISSAESLLPQVALLDIGMPKANGYEVARRIRAHAWGKQMFLVALTGWGQDADKRRAKVVRELLGANHLARVAEGSRASLD